MEKFQLLDNEEKVFAIRVDADNNPILELIYNWDVYHLISADGYVAFNDISSILKKDDDTYLATHGNECIVLTREEYDMIYEAMLFCKAS